MLKLLIRLIDNMGLLTDVLLEPAPYTKHSGGFAEDNRKLRGDAEKVANDLNHCIKKYGNEKHPN